MNRFSTIDNVSNSFVKPMKQIWNYYRDYVISTLLNDKFTPVYVMTWRYSGTRRRQLDIYLSIIVYSTVFLNDNWGVSESKSIYCHGNMISNNFTDVFVNIGHILVMFIPSPCKELTDYDSCGAYKTSHFDPVTQNEICKSSGYLNKRCCWLELH